MQRVCDYNKVKGLVGVWKACRVGDFKGNILRNAAFFAVSIILGEKSVATTLFAAQAICFAIMPGPVANSKTVFPSAAREMFWYK